MKVQVLSCPSCGSTNVIGITNYCTDPPYTIECQDCEWGADGYTIKEAVDNFNGVKRELIEIEIEERNEN